MLIIIIRTVGPTERSSSHDNERDENILQTNKENSRQKKKKKINLRRAASELGNWYVVGQVLASSSRKGENGRQEENGDGILDASYGTQVHIGKK